MKINDFKTAKKSRVKEAIDPALSFEHDDPEFAAKKRGPGYFDYSTLKREDFNDDDWYVWDPEKQQFVASYGARSSTALDFRMRESFGGTYKMPDGKIAMRGMRAKFMPGVESRSNNNLDEAAKTLQMIEGWGEFKETTPALKEIRHRRRQTNEDIEVRLDGDIIPGPYNDIDHARNKASKLISYQKGEVAEVYVDGKLKMRMKLNTPREYFDEQGVAEGKKPKHIDEAEDLSMYEPRIQELVKTGQIHPSDAAWMNDYHKTPGNSRVETGKGAFKDQSEKMQNFVNRMRSGEIPVHPQFKDTYELRGTVTRGGGGSGGVSDTRELQLGADLDPKSMMKREGYDDDGYGYKSLSTEQIMKLIQSGNWEAVQDVVPGKHIQLRNNRNGKKTTVHVKRDMAEGKKKRKKKSSRALSRYFFPGYGYYGGGESGEGGGEGGGESVHSRMAETSKSDFRNTVEQQALAAVERIKNSDYPDGIKKYLIAISDPAGPVFKAAYRSYSKGNEARDQLKNIFAQKYNIDPAELDKADQNEMAKQLTEVADLDENLRNWFKDKWVRFGPDGKIRGDCARGSESEGKPKCLPQSKAHALGKKGRASAAARKRREDPDANRTGAAINVATKKKTNEVQLDEKCWDTHKQVGMKKKSGRMVPNCVPKESQEKTQQCPECGGSMYPDTMLNEKKDACYYKVKASAKVWPSAYASGRLVQCRKRGAANYGKKNESVAEDQLDEKWSKKYKSSIDCNNPKGFSQRAHCAGRRKNEDVTEESNTNDDELFGPRAVTGTLLDRQALNVAKKLTTDKNLAKLNDMANDSTIYRALERYFSKNNISTTIFNRVAAIVFKKLDKYGRRLSTDPRNEAVEEDNAAALKTIRGPHGKLDVDRSEKGVTKVKRQNWRQSGGATVSGGYGVGVPQSTKFSSVDSERNANRRRPRLDRDEVSEEDDKDSAAKKPGFIDNIKQGAEDYKDLWMMGATGRTPERWKNSAEKAAERGSAPGPQFPLKEGRMKEIAIEFQDYKHLPDMAFQSRYKISKRDWWNKHAKLVQGSGLGIGMDEARGKVKAKIVYPRPTRAEREHDRIRKERGLPNPSHYKTLGDKLDQELAKLRGDDVTEAHVDADEMVDVYIKGQHKGRSIRIPVAKNFPNKHVDLLTQRLKSRGINPHAIVYGPTTRKVAEDTDQ